MMWLELAMWCLVTPLYHALPQLQVVFSRTTQGASIICSLQETSLDTAQDNLYEIDGYVILKRNQSHWTTMAEIFRTNPARVRLNDPRIVQAEGSVIDNGQSGSQLKITWDLADTSIFEHFRCDAFLKKKTDLHQHISQVKRMEPHFKISNFTIATPAQINSNRDAVNNTGSKKAGVDNLDAANPQRKVPMKRPQHERTTPKDNSMEKEEPVNLPNDEFRQNKDIYKSVRVKRSIDVLTTEFTTEYITPDPSGANNLDEFQSDFESIMTKVREIQQSLNAEDQKVVEDANTLIIFKNMTDQLRKVKMSTLRALHLISMFHYYKTRYLEKKIVYLESKLQIRENSLLNYSKDIMTALSHIPTMIYSSLDDSVHQWPQGTFAVLKPSAGCPLHPTQTWMEGFYKFHTESSDLNEDSYSENSHLSLPVKLLNNSQHFMNISFCVKDEINDRERPWPKGSYCINRKYNCPDGFSNGSIVIDDEDTGNLRGWGGILPEFLMDNALSFCCRSDASALQPIKLPFFAPFYLYRFNGICQDVIGMTSTEEYVNIDSENSNNRDKLSFPHPDGRVNNVNITLCYYEPLTVNLGREN